MHFTFSAYFAANCELLFSVFATLPNTTTITTMFNHSIASDINNVIKGNKVPQASKEHKHCAIKLRLTPALSLFLSYSRDAQNYYRALTWSCCCVIIIILTRPLLVGNLTVKLNEMRKVGHKRVAYCALPKFQKGNRFLPNVAHFAYLYIWVWPPACLLACWRGEKATFLPFPPEENVI